MCQYHNDIIEFISEYLNETDESEFDVEAFWSVLDDGGFSHLLYEALAAADLTSE